MMFVDVAVLVVGMMMVTMPRRGEEEGRSLCQEGRRVGLVGEKGQKLEGRRMRWQVYVPGSGAVESGGTAFAMRRKA